MDPVTVLTIINTAAPLIIQCGKTAQGLHNLAGKYKHSEIKILAMKNQCLDLKLAWQRIQAWCELYEGTDLSDILLIQRLDEDLELGTVIMSALENDLTSFVEAPRLLLWQRTKFVWNESIFKDHQSVLDRHVTSTLLLLQTTQLPSPKERNNFLIEKEEELNDCNETARTIVNSRASSVYTRDGGMSSEINLPLSDRTLDIAEELFESAVCKRNGWNITVARQFKKKQPKVLAIEDDGSRTQRVKKYDESYDENQSTVTEVSSPALLQRIQTEALKDALDSVEVSGEIVYEGKARVVRFISRHSDSTWSRDLIAACTDGDPGKVRTLVHQMKIHDQPTEAWVEGSVEAFSKAVAYDCPEVVRILLDHCIFSLSAPNNHRHAILHSQSIHPLTDSNKRLFYHLFEIARSHPTKAVLNELLQPDALSSFYRSYLLTLRPSSVSSNAADDGVDDSLPQSGTSSTSDLGGDDTSWSNSQTEPSINQVSAGPMIF